MTATYLDSSAIVKLVLDEPQSSALRRYLRRRPVLVSSALARTEVMRALVPEGEAAMARARLALDGLDLIRVNDRVLRDAGLLEPPGLRTLDAVHLATALHLEGDLGPVVTYDERMSDAARELGLRVAAPA